MGNNIMTMEEPLKRRKHKRFVVQEGAFVELRDHRGKIGEIIGCKLTFGS
jgi:hypothetical protein